MHAKLIRWCVGFVGAALLFAPTAGVASTQAVSELTAWRAYLVQGANLSRRDEHLLIRRGNTEWRLALGDDPSQMELTLLRRGEPAGTETVVLNQPNAFFTPMPAAAWKSADYDDQTWARYHMAELADFLGGYGTTVPGGTWPAKLYLRTRFGVDDPAATSDMRLTIQLIGGAVLYVNGREVGRAFMPAGEHHPVMPAEAYSRELYVSDEGQPLPFVAPGAEPEAAWRERYEQRVRTFSVNVPRDALVAGANVLAIEVHQAPVAGPMPRGRGTGWSHMGIVDVQLTSESGAGVVSFDEALRGPRIWSAAAQQQVANELAEQSLFRGSMRAGPPGRGLVKGIVVGNPFDPIVPVRMSAARNGSASGQVVLTDLAGLADVSAQLTGPLWGGDGRQIPAEAVQIRFAHQQPGLHYCDALFPSPPEQARTVPVWVLVDVPPGQAPGWYQSTLNVSGNGRTFQVPVQLLVSGATLPDPRDYQYSTIGVVQSPRSLALRYDVEPWSEEHWRLIERSLMLLGRLGDDVVEAPVLASNFAESWKDHVPRRPDDPAVWHQPLVRFVRTDAGLRPDFRLLERYLELYERHVGRPKALSVWMWETASAPEMADAYEGRRIPSRRYTPNFRKQVEVWNPQAGELSIENVPAPTDPGAREFWQPVLDGVRKIVTDRGWDERIIMLGLGGDLRPGAETANLLREWAPYARWDLLSHYSGDPPAQNGRLIATGGLEIGLKRHPGFNVIPTARLAQRLQEPQEYVELPTARWLHQEQSPPFLFRTLPLVTGRLGHVGLDFYMPRRQGPTSTSYFSHVDALSAAGPDGPEPTVRYQMLREGIQEFELRMMVVRASTQLADEQRERYWALLDELPLRMGWHTTFVSQHELAHDWPAYTARVQQAAAELTEDSSDARWDDPPAAP